MKKRDGAADVSSAAGEKTDGAPASAEKLSVVGYINQYRAQIMGVAALLIFLFHHWTTVMPQLFPNHPTIARISLFFLTHGHCGVDIFFLISGVGLVWAADKYKIGEFYLRRLKKVYVPFLIAYAVLIPATGGSFLRWIATVSGFTFLFVPAIMLLYLLFPLYNLLLKKLKFTVAVTVGSLVLWYLGALFLPIRYDLLGFYNRIPVFLIGVMLGRLEKDGRFPKTKLFFLAAPFLLAGGVISAYCVETLKMPLLVRLPNCFVPTLCLGLGTVLSVAFVLGAAHRFKIAGKIADAVTAPLSRLGKTSLAFYLVQMFTVRGIAYSDRGIISVSTGSTFWNDVLILAVAAGLAFILNTVSELINNKVLRKPGAKN